MLTDVLLAILRRLATERDALNQLAPEQAQRWQARSLLTQRRVRLRQGTTALEGRCLQVDAEGALVLATDTGKRRVMSGIIEKIEPPLAICPVPEP